MVEILAIKSFNFLIRDIQDSDKSYIFYLPREFGTIEFMDVCREKLDKERFRLITFNLRDLILNDGPDRLKIISEVSGENEIIFDGNDPNSYVDFFANTISQADNRVILEIRADTMLSTRIKFEILQ